MQNARETKREKQRERGKELEERNPSCLQAAEPQ